MTIIDEQRMDILARMGVQLWRPRQYQAHGQPPQVPGSEDSGISPGSSSDTGHQDGPEIQEQFSGNVRRENIVSETGLSSLEEIALSVSQCQRCQLHETRIQTVPGHGNGKADWMFVGEAPGQNEDEQGLPFVGRAGQLLNAMIASLGMERSDVFVVNALKCRPPGNRDPQADELAQCEPYLHQQLALIQPRVIVALGRISAQSLLKTDQPLGKIRNVVHHYGPKNIPLIATYHPAYLLRSPDQKVKSWQDLLLAKSIVSGRKQVTRNPGDEL